MSYCRWMAAILFACRFAAMRIRCGVVTERSDVANCAKGAMGARDGRSGDLAGGYVRAAN